MDDNQSENQPTEVEQRPANHVPRLTKRYVDELRPHPSWVRHHLTVSSSQLSRLIQRGERAFQQPLVITPTGVVVEGYARLELARRQGRETLLCLEYELTEEEALEWMLQVHKRQERLNDFTRIALALDMEPSLQEKARLNQQVGGQKKGLSTLSEAERVDVRREIALLADVSVGNVSKVRRILAYACVPVQQAAWDGEISIHRAEKLSHQTEAQQVENLRLFRIERCLRQQARNLVAATLISRATPDKHVLGPADLLRLLERLPLMASEKSSTFGPVTFARLSVPGKGIYVTEELLQAFKPEQEVLIR